MQTQVINSISFIRKIFYSNFFLKKPQKRAFTLTETIAVIAVAGILFGLGILTWQQAKQHQRLVEAVEQVELDLYDSFSTARNTNQSTQFLVIERGNDYYSINTDNPEVVFLPKGIVFAGENSFMFTPPYGDLDPTPKNTEIWLQNDRQKTGLKLYPKSGLIERLSVETLPKRDE